MLREVEGIYLQFLSHLGVMRAANTWRKPNIHKAFMRESHKSLETRTQLNWSEVRPTGLKCSEINFTPLLFDLFELGFLLFVSKIQSYRFVYRL